jgi:hypothetical protein
MSGGGGPIFIVGAPRSGTTLLAAMLDAHPSLDCGPESRFFARYRHLPRPRRRELLDPASWPAPAVEFVAGLENQGHPVHQLYGLSRDDLARWLGNRPPSFAALLESLTAQRAERNGKARWVEKTPRHLTKVRRIRMTWPEARVVRIVRDPRDVALSLSRVPFAGDSVVGNLVRIDQDDRLSRAFFARDRASWTLRYEDLVTEPERELRRLCDFLAESFTPDMVERRGGSGGVAGDHEWWKRDVSGPLDASRVGRWRQDMAPAEQRFAALHLAAFLEEHGYEGALPSRASVVVVPVGDAIVARHESVLLGLAERDLTVRRPPPRSPAVLARLARARPVAFVGISGQLATARPRGARDRAAYLVRLLRLLLESRMRRRPVLWVRQATLRSRRPRDPVERVTALLLRSLARSVEPRDVARLIDAPRRGRQPLAGGLGTEDLR